MDLLPFTRPARQIKSRLRASKPYANAALGRHVASWQERTITTGKATTPRQHLSPAWSLRARSFLLRMEGDLAIYIHFYILYSPCLNR